MNRETLFYIAAFVALVVDIILYSIYPVFNSSATSIGGLTVFYVYQLIMLVVSSILFLAVSLIFMSRRW
ncbi:MAG: hypothetical protein RXR43_08580 [Sulfolobus sp.]|jgi:hypothetical protein